MGERGTGNKQNKQAGAVIFLLAAGQVQSSFNIKITPKNLNIFHQKQVVISLYMTLWKSNIQFLGVSDFGDWLKGNVQEFSSF